MNADEVDVAYRDLRAKRVHVREAARVPRAQRAGARRGDLDGRVEPAREQSALQRRVARRDAPVARVHGHAVAE